MKYVIRSIKRPGMYFLEPGWGMTDKLVEAHRYELTEAAEWLVQCAESDAACYPDDPLPRQELIPVIE